MIKFGFDNGKIFIKFFQGIVIVMKSILRKIALGVSGISLLFVVGIFFDHSMVMASNYSGSAMDCENEMMVMRSKDCAAQKNLETKKAGPINNTFMPCCLERHDNSATILPAVLQDRIKISAQQSVVGEPVSVLLLTEQKTYLSSKSPPKKADILSSVVKKE